MPPGTWHNRKRRGDAGINALSSVSPRLTYSGMVFGAGKYGFRDVAICLSRYGDVAYIAGCYAFRAMPATPIANANPRPDGLAPALSAEPYLGVELGFLAAQLKL